MAVDLARLDIPAFQLGGRVQEPAPTLTSLADIEPLIVQLISGTLAGPGGSFRTGQLLGPLIQLLTFQAEQQIAAGELDLARETEARIARLEEAALAYQGERDVRDRELGQQDIYLTERGQDVTQRGQDIGAQLDFIGQQIDLYEQQRQDAIARGQLDLAAQIEERQRAAMLTGNQLAQRAQEIDQRQQDLALRSQDIDAQFEENQQEQDRWARTMDFALRRGDAQLARDAEARLRAAQRQQVALERHSQELEGARLGIEAQRGAGGILADLASSFGQQQTRRAEFLSGLAANPRDFWQLQYAMGGGQNAIERMLRGEAPLGQSVFQIGDTPTLGPGFERLAGAVTERPELAYYQRAGRAADILSELGERVPQAPGLDLLMELGAMPDISEAPELLAPPEMDFVLPERPGPVTPISDLSGGLTYTAQDVTREIQREIDRLSAAGTPPSVQEIGQLRQDWQARIGQPKPVEPQIGAVAAPDLQFNLPEPVAGLAPGSELSPARQEEYGAITAEQPNLPPGLAIDIAQQPLGGMDPVIAARLLKKLGLGDVQAQNLLEAEAGLRPFREGGLVLEEPAVLQGLYSGRPLATMGEVNRRTGRPTRELLTPFRGGMRIRPLDRVWRRATAQALGRR